MSKTDRLFAILEEWAWDIENTPPNRIIKAWVGHFHTHHGFGETSECIGAVLNTSRIRDVPASLAPYKLSQEITCSALALQVNEREFVVSRTDIDDQWHVTWSLDDYGKVTFVRVRPVTHWVSRRLINMATRSRNRGRLPLEEAVVLAMRLPDAINPTEDE